MGERFVVGDEVVDDTGVIGEKCGYMSSEALSGVLIWIYTYNKLISNLK